MARAHSFALFPTALGECAIAWSDIGVTAVWLPERDRDQLRRRIRRRAGGATEDAPAGAIAAAVDSLTRLLAGAHVGLRDVALDDADVERFDRRVYAVTREIAPGRVLTYGEVAARVGGDASARAVGQSLGRNAMPLLVPCHRVVASGGGLGGFSAPGGTATKRRLLAIENARAAGPPELFDVGESDATDSGTASGGESRADR